MSRQEDLIGPHPTAPNMFDYWLDCSDIPSTAPGCHRSLTPKVSVTDGSLVEWLAKRLIYHHYDESRLERLKQKFTDVGFPEYAMQHRHLPHTELTKKGNATEILLIEYTEGCQAKNLVKAFKLRYNPNVDQAIKGDDTLMVDIIKDSRGNEQLKVFLGESKFRAAPTKQVIVDICKSLGKDKLPLSYSYLVDELNRDVATKPQADLLDRFVIQEIKARGGITYTGLLLSNPDTAKKVEKHFATDNPDLILISIGLNDPETLINRAYAKADDLLTNPATLTL